MIDSAIKIDHRFSFKIAITIPIKIPFRINTDLIRIRK